MLHILKQCIHQTSSVQFFNHLFSWISYPHTQLILINFLLTFDLFTIRSFVVSTILNPNPNSWGLQPMDGTTGLDSAGQRFSSDITADASTPNAINPPITSNFDFYVTLTAELADDISLRHIVLTFNFIKLTNPNSEH